MTNPHIIDGQFQSDKYPTCPAGKVPLSVKDPMAQDLLMEYAKRRRSVDLEFSEALLWALLDNGYSGGDKFIVDKAVFHEIINFCKLAMHPENVETLRKKLDCYF